MITITHHRDKCIGCGYCVEAAPEFWSMSEEDGKSNLADGKKKRDFFVVRVADHAFEENQAAAEACPVNIIKVQ